MRGFSQILALVAVLSVPFHARVQAQETPTPNVSTQIHLSDQIAIEGKDNPIDLFKVADGCQPVCEVGKEVIWNVDPTNVVHLDAALFLPQNRKVTYVVPDGHDALLWKDKKTPPIQVNATDAERSFPDIVVGVVTTPATTPQDVRIPTSAINNGQENCQSIDCFKYQPFFDVVVATPLPDHCTSLNAGAEVLVLHKVSDNVWALDKGVAIPVVCDRFWLFLPSTPPAG